MKMKHAAIRELLDGFASANAGTKAGAALA
jgi:hypothetical protein